MKPTTLKTTKVKPLSDLSMGDQGAILAGGVKLPVQYDVSGNLRVGGAKVADGRWAGCEVTVTGDRPMTTEDLRVGDCFRIRGQCDVLAFMVWLGNHRVITVRHDHPQTVQQVGEVEGLEVTLVTPTFDAEPVEEERTVSVCEVDGEFVLAGKTGYTRGYGQEWQQVRWDTDAGIDPIADIPADTPVTVREQAAYDSWDDVSVGDVFVPIGPRAKDTCGIYVGNKRSLMTGLTYTTQMCPFRQGTPSPAPATLTDVSYERIDEVTR